MLRALASARTANRIKSPFSIGAALTSKHNPGCRYHNVYDRHRKKHRPTEPHQLIVAETRYREPDPHSYENEKQNLGDEVNQSQIRCPSDERPVPASEKQRGGDRRRSDEVQVLGHLKHHELY